VKQLPEKCQQILDVLMASHRKLKITEIGRPLGIQDNYAQRIISDKLINRYGYPIRSEPVPGKSHYVYWYDKFGTRKKNDNTRVRKEKIRGYEKDKKTEANRKSSIPPPATHKRLTAPYIYHEERVECLDCCLYWQAASIGERCNICFGIESLSCGVDEVLS